MKTNKKFATLLSLSLVLAVMASMLLASAVSVSAAEVTYDDTYTIPLNGGATAVATLDADFDIYGFKDSLGAGETAALHGPADPSADNGVRSDTLSYMVAAAYGSGNNGYLKFTQMDSAWYHALTYTKQEMENFVVEYSYHPHYDRVGVAFGAAKGVFPISRDSDNTKTPVRSSTWKKKATSVSAALLKRIPSLPLPVPPSVIREI